MDQNESPIQNKINIGLSELSNELSNSLNTTFNFIPSVQRRIDCDMLPEYGCNIVSISGFSELFERLNAIQNPTIYWFDIVGDRNTKEIRREFELYKTEGNRNVPALKKKHVINSNVLYVGKRKNFPLNQKQIAKGKINNIAGRMVIHFGYYHKETTQGLQLCHWAKDLGLILDLNVIELPFSGQNMDLINHYELKLSKILNPIIGKHK